MNNLQLLRQYRTESYATFKEMQKYLYVLQNFPEQRAKNPYLKIESIAQELSRLEERYIQNKTQQALLKCAILKDSYRIDLPAIVESVVNGSPQKKQSRRSAKAVVKVENRKYDK